MKLRATWIWKLATCGQGPTERRIVVTRTVLKAPLLWWTVNGMTKETGGSAV